MNKNNWINLVQALGMSIIYQEDAYSIYRGDEFIVARPCSAKNDENFIYVCQVALSYAKLHSSTFKPSQTRAFAKALSAAVQQKCLTNDVEHNVTTLFFLFDYDLLS